jgi:diguanylate cyclase (GGDEF)-like protein
MAISARDLKAAHQMGFYHCAIFPAIKLILGEFGVSQSHTEILKGISPLRASIVRLMAKQDRGNLLRKLDKIYEYVTTLKSGKYEDRYADAVINTIGDLCSEVEQTLLGFSDASLEERASFLFDSGRLLSIWHDTIDPPYKLSPSSMDTLIAKLKAAKLPSIAATAKSAYDSYDEDSIEVHAVPWTIHLAVLRQLDHESIHEAYASDAGEQALDPLTGLPSLQQFEVDSDDLLSDPEMPDTITFMDMDNLKNLNDKIGHDAVDEVIKQLAIVLETGLRHCAKVYHRSGDEFLAVFRNLSSREVMSILTRVIDRIRETTFTTSKGDVNISISAGIASFPEHAAEISTLRDRADEAMKQSKKAGKARAAVWSSIGEPSGSENTQDVVGKAGSNSREIEFGVVEDNPGEYRISIQPTVFFHNRICGSFPGIDGLQWFHDPKEALYRLELLLRSPVFFQINEGYGTTCDPIWRFRSSEAIYIKEFKKINETKCLLDFDELEIDKIAVFRSKAYWDDFVYVETKADPPSGIYSYTPEDINSMVKHFGYAYEEYGLLGDVPISRASYDDGSALIDGKVIDVSGAELRARYLSRYNFIIAPKFSPINSREFEKHAQSIISGLFDNADKLKTLVNILETLPRHSKDD